VIVLVLGGTRSGKSEVGERLAARLGDPVTFVATATVTDADMAARVEAHRARRPAAWPTVECGADLAAAVAGVEGAALVDSLGTWVAQADDLQVDTEGLVAALEKRRAPTVLVSEEVGLSVHAPTEVGRRFTDALGDVNRAVAAVADRVLLVVAGHVVPLDSADHVLGR
jgi:adenosyl cobinamide kinase/adenosyl cobinamide phosphate guanylyltransferase